MAAISCSFFFASIPAAWAARVIAWIVWLPPLGHVHGRFFDVSPKAISDLLPRHAEDLGRHAMAVADRPGSVIADPGLDVEAAIGLDHEQAVEPD